MKVALLTPSGTGPLTASGTALVWVVVLTLLSARTARAMPFQDEDRDMFREEQLQVDFAGLAAVAANTGVVAKVTAGGGVGAGEAVQRKLQSVSEAQLTRGMPVRNTPEKGSIRDVTPAPVKPGSTPPAGSKDRGSAPHKEKPAQPAKQGPGTKDKPLSKKTRKTSTTTMRQSSAGLTIAVCGELGLNLRTASGQPTPTAGPAPPAPYAPASAFLPLLLADARCGPALSVYLEMAYFKPCMGVREETLPPCRGVCLRAKERCTPILRGIDGAAWPEDWGCDGLPASGLCADMEAKVTPVPEPQTRTPDRSQDGQSTSYSVDTDNGGIVAPPSVKPRRYDFNLPGDKDLFHGWVDVQGQGAANDYCRVVGRNPSQRFLSCVLAGSHETAHTYVSERGVDLGIRHTWFMRDMDADGRDDYCRCVGRGVMSKVTCMKAGEAGFYGSIKQPGSQHTFILKTTGPCLNKIVNPFLGL